MKRLDVVAAVLVFAGLALGFWLARPAPPEDSLFGSQMALSAELPPLVLPGGALGLQGRVRHASGEPAADAFLTLLRADDDPSQAPPLYHAYSDAAGRFEFEGVAPGSYRAVLMHPSAPPRTLALELPLEGFPDGFPGELAWQLAAPLEPLPSLPEMTRTTLAGTLRWPAAFAAGSLAGFEVVLVPGPETELLAGACERRASSDEAGHFAFDELVAADYLVEVLPPWARGGSWPVLARARWAVRAEAPAVVELELAVGSLEGDLREAQARPVAGALVKVSALDARDATGEPQLWPPLVTDPDGGFRVELLPPGRYLLHLRAGSVASDVEVQVSAGQRTHVPLPEMAPRAGEATPGG